MQTKQIKKKPRGLKMVKKCSIGRKLALSMIVGMLGIASSAHAQLDENCVVNILNRTIQVAPDGGWSLPNVPSTMGSVRARATCVRDGVVATSGQSDFFTITRNGISRTDSIVFEDVFPLLSSLDFVSSTPSTIDGIGSMLQLSYNGDLPQGFDHFRNLELFRGS